MNMLKYILVLITLIIYINCENDSNCKGSAYKGSDCFEKNDSSNEDHCCYFTGKNKQDSSSLIKQCINVENDYYEDFDKLMDLYKEKYDEVSIDCKSYYFNYGILLNLIIILLEVFN